MVVLIRRDLPIVIQEEKHLIVDGQPYVVIRDEQHNVFLHGPDGKRVPRPGVFNRPTSIFRSSDEEWATEIRNHTRST